MVMAFELELGKITKGEEVEGERGVSREVGSNVQSPSGSYLEI